MDELFREAAENYPLKVTGADWSKVQSAIPGNNTNAPGKPPSNKKWWGLLLLLLVPFVCTVLNNRSNNDTQKTAAIATTATKEKPAAEKTGQQSNTPQNNIPNGIAASQQPETNVSSINRAAQDQISGTTGLAKAKSGTHVFTGRVSVTTVAPAAEEGNIVDKTALPSNQRSLINTQSPIADNGIQQKDLAIVDKKNELPVIKEKPKTAVPADTKKTATSDSTAGQQKNKKLKQAKFYLSLLGGPDASRVRSENVKHIGFSAGLSLGYNINKHFAAEAAVLYSDKHYKSAYKDFNNSKTNWSSYDIIRELAGECKMIEIPVTLRYNFSSTHAHRFFAAAGLSSYIMKKESYSYDYTYSTSPGARVYSASQSFSNSSRNWFSVLQLSAGWQRNIAKKISVRVQPYYNVPLSGVGIGSLPISGAGILAGLSIPIK